MYVVLYEICVVYKGRDFKEIKNVLLSVGSYFLCVSEKGRDFKENRVICIMVSIVTCLLII